MNFDNHYLTVILFCVREQKCKKYSPKSAYHLNGIYEQGSALRVYKIKKKDWRVNLSLLILPSFWHVYLIIIKIYFLHSVTSHGVIELLHVCVKVPSQTNFSRVWLFLVMVFDVKWWSFEMVYWRKLWCFKSPSITKNIKPERRMFLERKSHDFLRKFTAGE